MAHGVIYEFGGYRLSVAARGLWYDDAPVVLPYRAFDCLAYLIEHCDRAVGRDELVAAVWGRVDVSDAQLGQIILRVRRAVGDDGNVQQAIRTVPKFGYHWVAATRVLEPESQPLDSAASTIRALDVAVAAEPLPPVAFRLPPSAANSSARWFLPILIVMLGMTVLAVVLAALLRDGGADVDPVVGVLVLPVDIDVDAEPEHAWARLGAMDLIAGRLRAAGLPVPPSETILSILHARQHVADPTALDAADPESLRLAIGAEMLIVTRLEHDAGLWRLSMVAARPDGAPIDIDEQADDLLAAARSASDRLLIQLGRPPPASERGNERLEETVQRTQAALLANRLDVARAILSEAPTQVRSELRFRYVLAQIDIRTGRWPEVRTAMLQLLAEPMLVNDPKLHGGVLNTLGAVHINMDQAEAAERYHDAAVDVLLDAGDPFELGRAYGGRSLARGAQLRFDEALTDYGLARAQLGRVGDRLMQARIDLSMASLELRRPRLQQARALLEQALPDLESMGAINELLYGLTLLFRVEMAELDYASAQTVNERAWALRDHATDPESRHLMTIFRAEVLLATGRHTEAEALLAGLTGEGVPPNQWALGVADWLRARSAWAQGDAAGTLAYAEAASARITSPEHDAVNSRLALLRQRALLTLGREREAHDALTRFERARGELSAGTDPVPLSVTRAELAARGDRPERADDLFQTALARAEVDAVPEDLLLAGAAYAEHLLALNRLEEAGAIIGRLALWAERDYRSALLQVRLHHALGQTEAWSQALNRAQELAGERTLPAALTRRSDRLRLSADPR